MQTTDEKRTEQDRIVELVQDRVAILANLHHDDEVEDSDSYAVDHLRLELVERELRRLLGS